jgi:hypothetical protein
MELKMDSELNDETQIGSAGVCARYDDISRMTLHRWLKDPELGFPEPVIVRRRRRWTLGQLRAWERQRAARVVS